MTTRISRFILSCFITFFIISPSFTHAGDPPLDSNLYQTYVEKEYLLFFYYVDLWAGGFEFVDLELSDNGSFSLSSDLFNEPAHGTYERNLFSLKGRGKTARFVDDILGDMEMIYEFVGIPIGFQAFFMLGVGSREYRFYEESGHKFFSSTFVFGGEGF